MQTNDAPLAVSVVGLSKSWPSQRRFFRKHIPAKPVLDSISFAVARGEIVAILGENGAGKTTILKILAEMITADEGDILLFDWDEDFGGSNDFRNGRVAYSGGERGFYFRLTVRENLRFFGSLEGLRASELTEMIATVSNVLEIDEHLDRRFSDLSSGLRQRTAIARAMITDPELLLLDEPTRTLDPLHAERFRLFLRDTLVRDRRTTVIIATNVLEEAFGICDRIFILREARLEEYAVHIGQTVQPAASELFASGANE